MTVKRKFGFLSIVFMKVVGRRKPSGDVWKGKQKVRRRGEEDEKIGIYVEIEFVRAY